MNPVTRSELAGFRFAGRDADTASTESTESCSEEEDAGNSAHEEAVVQLARALMAWSPELIGPDVAACASHPAAGTLAVFLTQLEMETRPRLQLRREALAWLNGLGGHAARQQQVLDKVRETSGTGAFGSAIALYQLLSKAD